MSDTEQDLCWRAEEACLNAWPCTRQLLWSPWLVRIQGGSVRRANSVNPLRAERYDSKALALLGPAAELYARHGQPLIVRAPDIAPGLDARLEQRGFSAEGETCTLFADLGAPQDGTTDLTLNDTPDVDWLALRQRLSGANDRQQALLQLTLAAIVAPKRFALLRRDGRPAALAFGVLHAGLLVLEAVATDPDYRNRGCARQTLAGLFAWAQTQGVGQGCLQVEADNAPALALYRRLGFGRELYRYRYRRPPGG